MLYLYIQFFLGRPIESFDKCVGFYQKIVDDPSLSADVIPRFYLTASIAVMLVFLSKIFMFVYFLGLLLKRVRLFCEYSYSVSTVRVYHYQPKS